MDLKTERKKERKQTNPNKGWGRRTVLQHHLLILPSLLRYLHTTSRVRPRSTAAQHTEVESSSVTHVVRPGAMCDSAGTLQERRPGREQGHAEPSLRACGERSSLRRGPHIRSSRLRRAAPRNSCFTSPTNAPSSQITNVFQEVHGAPESHATPHRCP